MIEFVLYQPVDAKEAKFVALDPNAIKSITDTGDCFVAIQMASGNMVEVKGEYRAILNKITGARRQ